MHSDVCSNWRGRMRLDHLSDAAADVVFISFQVLDETHWISRNPAIVHGIHLCVTRTFGPEPQLTTT